MKREVLGLLALMAGETAFGQYPYQPGSAVPGEPVPIQSFMPPAAGYQYPAYSPWPGQGMPMPQPMMQPMMQPAMQPMPQPIPGYQPAPMGYSPTGYQNNLPGAGGMPMPGMPAMPAAVSPPLPPVAHTQGSPANVGPTEPYLASPPLPGSAPPAHSDEPYFEQFEPWKAPRGAQVYAYGDYLLWWTKQQTAPAINVLPGFNLSDQFGNFNNDPRSGARATIGWWLTPMKNLAFEASYFYLGQESQGSAVVLPGSATTLLPFFAGINSQTGAVNATTHLWGAEANLRRQICYYKTGCTQWFFDIIGGFRYLDLSEGIGVQSTTAFAPAPVLLGGTTLATTDNFFTHNNFYGGQIGAGTDVYWWRIHVNLFGKVALGDNVETVNVNGSSAIIAPPGLPTLPGGLLTAASNIGHHTDNHFAAVPEGGVNLGFRVCQFCELGAGYSFLYFSDVVRPGDHIPATVTPGVPTGLTGGQPTFNLQQSHFWAHGLNVRVMFIF